MLIFCISFLFVHVLTFRISFFFFFSRIKLIVFFFNLMTISLCLNAETNFCEARNNAFLKSVELEIIDFFKVNFFMISMSFVIFLSA